MNAVDCMGKALAIVWGVWRSGQDFDPSKGGPKTARVNGTGRTKRAPTNVSRDAPASARQHRTQGCNADPQKCYSSATQMDLDK